MTQPKGAVPALRLTLPGASHTWHTVGDIGLFHADFAVPLEELGIDEARAKQIDKDKGCPLGLEFISKADSDAASTAHALATGDAVQGTVAAARGVQTQEERSRVSSSIEALKGTDAGAAGDTPDPPKEG